MDEGGGLVGKKKGKLGEAAEETAKARQTRAKDGS
jgi:hypothetical protein